MKVSVRKKEDYEVSQWSGGTTTQMYIYPENGDYAKRQFQVRISSATVEDESSKFTSLPGVQRYLMTLDGELKLVHEGKYEKSMHPYEVERFPGDWETSSYGKVRDFNLMLKEGARGMMEFAEIQPGNLWVLPLCKDEWNKILIYSINGDIRISDKTLETGELAVLEDFSCEQCVLENQGAASVKLVICRFTL